MSIHRSNTGDPAKNGFEFSGYRKRTTDCSVHYLRDRIFERIVLENMRRMTAFARDDPEDFYGYAMKKGRAEAKKQNELLEKRKKIISDRIAKLNNILSCMYEDRVVGRITPELTPENANTRKTKPFGYRMNNSFFPNDSRRIVRRGFLFV